MADKTIGELPLATMLNDDALLVAEQNGEAVAIPGSLLKVNSTGDLGNYVQQAKDAAAQAKQAAADAQKAADSVADVTEDVEAAQAAREAAEAAQTAAETARQAAEDAASAAAENAANDAVAEVDTKLADYVASAQDAQKAAEQARDEAQAIAGGDFLSKSGGTLTGALTLAGDPTEELHAATKKYVDEIAKNIDPEVTADEVTFADGETFQQKYDNGELNGKSGVYVGSGEMPEGYNVQIDPEGELEPFPVATIITKKLSWLSRYGTVEQNGLIFDPIAMTYTGEAVSYTNKAIALPLNDDAEWQLEFNFASYTKGQFVGFNAEGLYNRFYIGSSTAETRMDVRFGFAFDYTDETNSSGIKYYNFTWKGLTENIWSGAHTLKFTFSKRKLTLSIDNGEAKEFNSFVVGNSAEIELSDSDGLATKTIVELIQAHTGSKQLVFNGGGSALSDSLKVTCVFNSVNASIKAKQKDICEYAPAPALFDKNIQFLGSSIFYGSTGTPKGESFVDILNRRWGTNFQKQAVGGTTLAIQDGKTNSYCERYANFTNKDTCDALVIQLSTNDFAQSIPVGSVGEDVFDVDSFDNTTICGAIEWLISTAKQNNPNVKVVFVSCPMLSGWTNYNAYQEFNDGLMQTIVAKWGIELVDLFNDNQPWSGNSTYWSASTTAPTSSTYHLFYNDIHMNDVGYSLFMAPKIAAKLLDILED